MKKILYVITQSHFGGAQKYVHDLALELSTRHKVTVAVGEGDEAPWMQELRDAGIEVIRLKHVKRNLSPWHDFLSGFELFNLYRKIQPDVIHLNSSKVGATGAVTGFFYNISNYGLRFTIYAKVIYTVHGLVLNEPLSLPYKIFYWFAEWCGALFKDALICVSEHDKQSVLRYHIAPEKKVYVVHNGIDVSESQFLDRNTARAELFQTSPHLSAIALATVESLTTNPFIIGTIAGHYKTKGLTHALKALLLLPNNVRSNIHYILIGDGPERSILEKYITEHNLSEIVTLTTVAENAAQYLKAFDLFILPSVKEGLSYTLIEARAAGLPIITTTVGGNPEIVTNNETGLLVPPADPQALADAITKLHTDENLRVTLANNARNNIDKFSLHTMVQETVQYYN